jgi:hypothetical protein
MKARALAKSWAKQPFFSPAGFVLRAAMLALIYWVASMLGFRSYMSMLSWTFPEGGSVGWALFAGTVYLITYFLWILGVPILLIAAALMAVAGRILAAWGSRQPPIKPAPGAQ